MNKIFKSLSLILFLFSLSSCIDVSYSTKRKNYIQEGIYSGENSTYSVTVFLSIKRIYKEEFITANGINVIEDLVRPAYYSMDFYYYEGEDKKPYYTFSNFNDVYDGSHGTHIAYRDDYGCFFVPRYFLNQDKKRIFHYSISLMNRITSFTLFSVALYPVDS